MKISILIAHYNNYSYFLDCYNSITKQTFQDFEVIIVDDYSTDDSYEKIKKLIESNPKINLYQNKENKGVGFTKKKCVEMATGEICGFLDPDDALLPNALETIIKKHNQKDTVAVYSQFYLCDKDLLIQKIFPNTRRVKNNNPLFFNIHFEVAHFFTFKREAYLKTEGINEIYKVAEDIDFYLKLYEIGRFSYIKQPLYLYRIHEKGLSHDQKKTELKNKTWHTVLFNALKRRGITHLYDKKITDIENLPKFILKKENTFLKKLILKFQKIFQK